MVWNGVTCVEHEIMVCNIEHAFFQIIAGKNRRDVVLLFNVYSNASQREQKFKTPLRNARTSGGSYTLLVCATSTQFTRRGATARTLRKREICFKTLRTSTLH